MRGMQGEDEKMSEPFRQLWYAESGTNARAARHLSKKFHLEAKAVPSESARIMLPKLRGRALLLWGDGFEHQLSHFFEIREGHGKKTGLDNHTDLMDALDVNFRSHFLFSGLGNHHVTVYLPHWRGWQVGGTAGIPGLHSHEHISVDLDCLEGFPAAPSFSVGTASPESLLGFLRESINGKLMRFDMSGLERRPSEEEFRHALGIYEKLLSLLGKKGMLPPGFEPGSTE